MRPRRLLVVTDEMEVGGSQRQITYLLTGLNPEKWQASLAYFRNSSFLVDALVEHDVEVHYLPKRGRLDPRFVLRYMAHVRQGRYDLIHAFSMTAELYTAIACLFMRDPPRLVSSIRGMYLLLPGWFWVLKRWVLGRSDAIVANARAGVDAAMSRTSLPSDRFDLVPNGVAIPDPMPAERRAALRSAHGLPDYRCLALFVGRMVHQKNPSCLVRAMRRLPAEQRPLLLMVGDGPLRQETEAMVIDAGLQNDVVFLGERAQTIELMQAADFLVLPSLHEGMPNVLLEAMSAGCPVIASDVGGNPELIEHARTGLLFPNDDDSALAEALARFVENSELRNTMATHARELALQRFSVAAMLAETELIYERCLRNRPATRPEQDESGIGARDAERLR